MTKKASKGMEKEPNSVEKKAEKEPKLLTELELYKIQLSHEEQETQKLKIANQKLRMQLAAKEKALFQLMIKEMDRKYSDLATSLVQFEQGLADIKSRHKEVLVPIRDRLELPEKFGFNEMTREIVEGDDDGK